jgi:hypothetical protein
VISLWTIYERPSDYPDGYIARRWELGRPTVDVLTSTDLKALRNQLQERGLYCLVRHPYDEPHIIETWL